MNESAPDNAESVSLLYEWLPRLYETAERRYVAADNRIQWVLGFSVTLFVSVGAFLKVNNAVFVFNAAFWSALGVLVVQAILGLLGLAAGGIRSFGLTSVITNGLSLSPSEFKLHALANADSDITGTTASINRKGWVVWILVLGLVIESGTIFWWITTLSTSAPIAP